MPSIERECMMWDDDIVVRELAIEESWRLLRTTRLGRLAVSVAGRVDIYPVNYTVDRGDIVFRANPGTKLLELTIAQAAAFEIDGHSATDAWSVVAQGPATRVERQPEIDRAEALPLSPWISPLRFTLVRMTPTEISGRAFLRGLPARAGIGTFGTARDESAAQDSNHKPHHLERKALS
jgi:nitroimidazol reductase NimA-like FMN-containing flavoprotein (pyridoxamine 5'-phosphate oxidase superfamily)